MSTRVIQKKIKSLSKEYVRDAFEFLVNRRHFWKSLRSFCLQNYREQL